MLSLNKKQKKYQNWTVLNWQDKREKLCVRFMREGKYEELEELLRNLYEDKKWRHNWPDNHDIPFQHILEKALQIKDQKAVDIVLKFVKIVLPISSDHRGPITDDPVLFRNLIKSRKLDWSPHNVMALTNDKYDFEGTHDLEEFEVNLMEMLILLHKPELVRILLEEGYSYEKSDRGVRDRTFGIEDHNFDDALWGFGFNNPLELAISVCDKEITKIFMEQGKYEFRIINYKIEAKKKKQKEFLLWMMEEYPEQLLEKMDLDCVLTQCGAHHYKEKIFEFYKEKKGMETLLRELSILSYKVLKEERLRLFDLEGPDQFAVLSVICAIDKLKRMAENQKEKETINEIEQTCFLRLRDVKDSCIHHYPLLFLLTADYWYRKEKTLSQKMIEKLLFIYFCWNGKKPESVLEQSCLTSKEVEALTQKSVTILDKLMEQTYIKHCAPFISLELMKEKVNKRKIAIVMDKLVPEQNRTIEQTEENASFLAFLLLQDSPMLVKKAWKRQFLTGKNLSEAVKFIVTKEKTKVLPYLYEYVASSNTELEEYAL